METTSCYALTPLSVFDPVKIQLDKASEGKTCKKCSKGKPNGLSTVIVKKFDPESNDGSCLIGSRIGILQRGIIPHRQDWDYRLDDSIYVKGGELTTEVSPYRVGKVMPDGIYINFLD